MTHRKTFFLSALLACLFCLGTQASAEIKRFEAADSEGVTAARDARAVYLEIGQDVKGPITIPRLAAPLRSIRWHNHDENDGITLKPEQETWVISWKNRPKDSDAIILSFDGYPWLMEEVLPGSAACDGSFYVPAHLAFTKGENIRYEPQPHKNTVGFWTGDKDAASWMIQLEKPGRFNVSVLQGCGKGQGGSTASMSFIDSKIMLGPKLDFQVVETGHFQNFQWQHLGEIELTRPGVVAIYLAPVEIKKAALMDIRAIHLIRLPDKK